MTVGTVLELAVFTGKWSYLYFVSGTLGAVSLVLALAYLIDSAILGRKGTFFSAKKTRKVSRFEEAKWMKKEHKKEESQVKVDFRTGRAW
ncbi:hypothetical protein AB3N02_06420 [Priestia aryabhattai]|uniref:hypothetical protein n=1 Tax=Priestia aryabhattai TaxID=412384 RepID=UPI00399F2791